MERFSVAVAVSAGLCGAALALSPDGGASPLRTGGPGCIDQLAGAAPMVPMALPGPVAGAVPLAPVVPVVPAAPVVPPVPVAPVVPVAPAAPIVPVAGAGAGALPAGGLPAAPVTQAAGTGKGAPTAPPASKIADPVVLPGPPQSTEPIPAVLAGSTMVLPGCAAVAIPAR